jgi:hypothetical protein
MVIFKFLSLTTVVLNSVLSYTTAVSSESYYLRVSAMALNAFCQDFTG